MSKKRVLSRGPQVNMDVCVENGGGNRFNLILIAAARAREIRRKNAASESFEHNHTVVTALLEVQAGIIGEEYLAKVR